MDVPSGWAAEAALVVSAPLAFRDTFLRTLSPDWIGISRGEQGGKQDGDDHSQLHQQEIKTLLVPSSSLQYK